MSGGDPNSDDLLRGFIKRVLTLREERAMITADIKLVMAEAKSTGFDPVKIGEVCRSLEKFDKFGRDEMLAAEAIFHLYRDVYEDRPALADEMSSARDKALVQMFAGPEATEKPKTTARRKAANTAAALANAARLAEG